MCVHTGEPHFDQVVFEVIDVGQVANKVDTGAFHGKINFDRFFLCNCRCEQFGVSRPSFGAIVRLCPQLRTSGQVPFAALKLRHLNGAIARNRRQTSKLLWQRRQCFVSIVRRRNRTRRRRARYPGKCARSSRVSDRTFLVAGRQVLEISGQQEVSEGGVNRRLRRGQYHLKNPPFVLPKWGGDAIARVAQ